MSEWKDGDIELNYFKPEEFHGWYEFCSPKLLVLLDEFRENWGAPVMVSPAKGAVGRKLGNESESQHNFSYYGEVRACDVMPFNMGDDIQQRKKAYRIAKDIGFTGIGIYPDWKPMPGMHLDVRDDRMAGDPAIWSGFDIDGEQQYFSIYKAL